MDEDSELEPESFRITHRKHWRSVFTYPQNRRGPSNKQQIQQARDERKTCRSLANAMCTKLPRELRDQIYFHLVHEHPMYHQDYIFRGLTQAGKNDLVDPEARIFCPAYVGRQIAKEAAGSYYDCNLFQLHGIGELASLLNFDLFELGLRPSKHIRKLHVTVEMEKLCEIGGLEDAHYIATYLWEGVMKPPDDPIEDIKQLVQFHDNLEAMLKLLVQQAKLSIKFELNQHYNESDASSGYDEMVMAGEHSEDEKHISSLETERKFINMLEALRKPVYDLIHAGADVDVSLGEDIHLTKQFFLDKKDWEQEKKKNMCRSNHYSVEKNLKPQNTLVKDYPRRYNKQFAEQLPGLGKRWGYESFVDVAGIEDASDSELGSDVDTNGAYYDDDSEQEVRYDLDDQDDDAEYGYDDDLCW